MLLLLLSLPAGAQLASFGDVPVEINADQTRFENGLAVGENNVVIRYGATTIYCDYAQYNPDTRDALLRGNIRIYRDGQLFTGERAVFNFETKTLRAADFHGESYPFKFTADTVSSIGPKAFEARDAVMTTSDSSKPDYYFKARTVRIYPKDRVVFSNVTLYVGKTPVFWFPYLYQSLDRDTSFFMMPGYQSLWGASLLTRYSFPIGDDAHGKLRLDLRSKRGAAVGFDSDFRFGNENESWGKFVSYYANDTHPETNDTAYARQTISHTRYRVSLQSKAYLTDDIYANIDINKLSDALFLQDFYQSEFRANPQPDNVVSLTKWDEDYTVTAIVRKQLNNFFEGTERLPEFALDIKRQALFASPIFYEGETSVSRLSRNFANGNPFPDYSTTRVDTFLQFLYPKTYFDWLTFTPRVGIRGTYYSSTGETGQFIDTGPTPEALFAAPTSSTTPAAFPLNKGGSVFRPVVTAGFEASTKFSRPFEEAQSRAWGLDGLLHIVQPYTDFSYVYTGKNPEDILQFDRFNPSTQLPPLDLAEFNSIDSIANWTIWRFGVRNRLETRRDNQTFEWFSLDSFVDVNIHEPQYPGITAKQGTVSNVFNNLRWNPLPWFGFSVDSQLPVSSKGFTEINTALNFMVNPNLKFDVGHRYISGNPYFDNSSLLTFGAYYRVNDNWAVSMTEQYEMQDHTLQYQTYQIHRDLSSWIASLGVTIQDNRVNGLGSVAYGVMMTFTLKDFPQISTPFSFGTSGL